MRTHFFLYLFIVSALTSCQSQHAHHKNFVVEQKSQIGKEIERSINETDSNVNIGIKIVDLTDGHVIYEKNPDRHFVPASTIKLLTLASALHYLGPSFRFDTTIHAEGLKTDKHTAQNLIIEGSGDPSLTDRDLMAMALELKQLGLKTITGDLIVDDSIFDQVPWSDSMMVADREKGFGAPVSGLNINHNRFLFRVRHGGSAGQKALIVSSPSTSSVSIINDVTTVSNNKAPLLKLAINKQETAWPEIDRLGIGIGDQIQISGAVSLKNESAAYKSFAIKDPSMFAGELFKEHLKNLGIDVKGSVKRGIKPATTVMLTRHRSRSLAEALTDFTKISNNVGNDCLTKMLAAHQGLRPASLKDGLKIMGDFLLNDVKVSDKRFVFGDGSGLSRYNLLTPSQLVSLLTFSANNFLLGPEFITALPIAGTDGLLSNRMRTNALKRNIRAKTGSMSGLNSLAGYFVSEDGRRFAFAIMINGFVGPGKKYTDLQDRILSLMYSATHKEPKKEL